MFAVKIVGIVVKIRDFHLRIIFLIIVIHVNKYIWLLHINI